MKKYILDKGFISRGAHVSYEVSEEYATFEEAKKESEFKVLQLKDNEYVEIAEFENDEYEVVYYIEGGDNNE